MPTASVEAKHFNGLGAHLGNMWTYVNTGLVGSGAPQVYNHGGGRRPLMIIVQVDDESNSTAIIGVSDNKNLTVTVTNSYTYSILAFFGPGAS